MSNLKIQADWIQSDEKEILLAKTASNLLVEVNGCSLTRNINIWDHKASVRLAPKAGQLDLV